MNIHDSHYLSANPAYLQLQRRALNVVLELWWQADLWLAGREGQAKEKPCLGRVECVSTQLSLICWASASNLPSQPASQSLG